MKKPFAVLGFAALAALMATVFLNTFAVMIIVIMAAIGFFVLFILTKAKKVRPYKVVSAVLATISLALFLYQISFAMYFQPYQSIAGEKHSITAIVQEYPETRYGRFYYKVKVTAVETDDQKRLPVPFTIRLSVGKAIKCKPYDTIKCSVTFLQQQEKFGFSSQSSYRAKGISATAYVNDYNVPVTENAEKPFLYFFQQLRLTVAKQLRVLLPKDEASLANAMIVGDVSGVSDDISFAFRQTGTTHLLVVSGMHMTLVAALALGILRFLRVRGSLANLLAIVAVIIFMFFTGFQSSVMRSGIMCIIYLLGKIIHRQSDSLNTLGFSVLTICIAQPQIGGDIGFLLSVFATLGIIKLSSPMEKFLMKPFYHHKVSKAVVHPVVASLSASFSATLFVLPVQIYLFGGFSVFSPLTTLVLSLPTSLMLYSTFFALVLGKLFAPLAAPFTLATGICAKFSIWFVAKMAELGGYIGAVEGFGLLAVCGVLILAACLLGFGATKKLKRITALMSVCIIITAATAQHFKYKNCLTIAVANAGESPCVVLLYNNEAAVLAMQSYNTTAVREILMLNNIQNVAGMALTDDSRETMTAAAEILKRYPVKEIALQDELYIPRSLKEAWSGIPKSRFIDTVNCDWLPPVSFKIGAQSINFSYQGISAVLELGAAEKQQADLLIASKANSLVNSPFTVFLSDDIIGTEQDNLPRFSDWKNQKAGTYLFAAQQKILYIDIFSDGNVKIRREA